MDFGTSRKVDDTASAQELDSHQTYRWSSPELLLGEFKTLASDVYAFAMTVFEVLLKGSWFVT
jgi:hypothetical protein